jgi:putative transposase
MKTQKSTSESSKSHYRAERIVIRQGHEAFKASAYCCQIARRIKNATHYLIRNQLKGNGKPLSHSDADKWLKKNNPELYQKLPAAMSQRTTQICGQEWSSFYGAIKDFAKRPARYKARPRPPKYAYRASTLHIGRNGFKVENGVLVFASSVLPNIKTSFAFSQNWNEITENTIAQEVRIIPNGNSFTVELIYNAIKLQQTDDFCLLLDKSRQAGIDLGINNLIALASDQPGIRPVLINGKPLKSINAWYNKRAAKLRSQKKYSHLKTISNKRYNRVRDCLHQASRYVVDYCVSNNIGTLVIGHNDGWKQYINIGKVNNQKFVNIPHSILIEQIQYKAYSAGITVIVREESYTSKASALDNDDIPTHGDSNIVAFSGYRAKRGLYKSPLGILNADINAALNILRKETGKALDVLACRGCVSQPILITLGKLNVINIKRKATGLPKAA